jgi:hypothetical protein
MNLRASVSALITMFAVAACGGGGSGDDIVTVVDAAVDAAPDARIDAPPPVCNPPNMMCGTECVDVTSSEDFCGNCMTSCSGGQVCNASVCACAANITVPANPMFAFSQVQGAGMSTIAFGLIIGNPNNVLVVGRDTADTAVNMPHTLSGMSLGTPPFAAFGYDVDIGSMTVSAAYYATAGTLTFTKICLEDTMTGQMAGFSGTLTGATFSAVDSLMNPVIVPGGCTFSVPGTVTFSYGNTSCQ